MWLVKHGAIEITNCSPAFEGNYCPPRTPTGRGRAQTSPHVCSAFFFIFCYWKDLHDALRPRTGSLPWYCRYPYRRYLYIFLHDHHKVIVRRPRPRSASPRFHRDEREEFIIIEERPPSPVETIVRRVIRPRARRHQREQYVSFPLKLKCSWISKYKVHLPNLACSRITKCKVHFPNLALQNWSTLS